MTKPLPQINALATEVGVNMGDHGQDVHRAIAVTPSTTLGELMAAAAGRKSWDGEVEWKTDVHVTLRLALEIGDAP